MVAFTEDYSLRHDSGSPVGSKQFNEVATYTEDPTITSQIRVEYDTIIQADIADTAVLRTHERMRELWKEYDEKHGPPSGEALKNRLDTLRTQVKILSAGDAPAEPTEVQPDLSGPGM